MRYIKDNKKSKSYVYVLCDNLGHYQHDEIIDLRRYDKFNYNGGKCTDHGYKEIKNFVFSCSFVVGEAGKSSRYTNLLYLVDKLEVSDSAREAINAVRGWAAYTDHKSTTLGISTDGLSYFFRLCAKNPQDFKVEIVDGITKLTGIWTFETNKKELTVLPYSESAYE